MQSNSVTNTGLRGPIFKILDKVFHAEELPQNSPLFKQWLSLRETYFKSLVALGASSITFSMVLLALRFLMPEGARMPEVAIAVLIIMLGGFVVSIWHMVSFIGCLSFKHSRESSKR